MTDIENKNPLLILVIAAGFFLFLLAANNRGFSLITTDISTGIQEKIPITKAIINALIMPFPDSAATGALCDAEVKIPEKSKIIGNADNLDFFVSLINFGNASNVNASLAYIITNSKGDIVFIEHEKRMINTQAQFLKTINLSGLERGEYKLFLEMLYSNTSAIGTDTFEII